jgi:hypothetical protein
MFSEDAVTDIKYSMSIMYSIQIFVTIVYILYSLLFQ